MSDEPLSETSEEMHSHMCPVCMDLWQHADRDCDEPVIPIPAVWVRRTWARCPVHEGESE